MKQFNVIAATFYEHYDEILNFYNHRSTNAAAESFNAKIKLFRANQHGVADKNSSSSESLSCMAIPTKFLLPLVFILIIRAQKICLTYFELCQTYFEISQRYFSRSPYLGKTH